MARRNSALIAFFLVLVSCADEATTASRVTIRDSAGIEIVEAPLDRASLARWTVSDEPALEIGLVEGDSAHQFFRITDVVRMSDGRILVANGGTNELRAFSAAGEHLRTVGGTGEGPGEYRGMRGVWRLAGDTLLVADQLEDRTSRYTPSLDLIETVPNRRLAQYNAPPPIGFFGDGRRVVVTTHTIGEVPDPVDFPGVVLAWTGDSTAVDTLAVLPGTRAYFERCGRDLNAICRLASAFPPFFLAVVSGDTVFAGNGDDFSIHVLDADRKEVAQWRVITPARPVTAADIDAFHEETLAFARNDEGRRRIERSFESIPVPDHMPAFSQLLNDGRGGLWVREYRTSTDSISRYLVLGRDGAVRAQVDLPGDLDVHQVGSDFVLGVRKDEADVEFVRLYRLDRTR